MTPLSRRQQVGGSEVTRNRGQSAPRPKHIPRACAIRHNVLLRFFNTANYEPCGLFNIFLAPVHESITVFEKTVYINGCSLNTKRCSIAMTSSSSACHSISVNSIPKKGVVKKGLDREAGNKPCGKDLKSDRLPALNKKAGNNSPPITKGAAFNPNNQPSNSLNTILRAYWEKTMAILAQ